MKRYVLHEGRSGKIDRWSLFDNLSMCEVKGHLTKYDVIGLLHYKTRPRLVDVGNVIVKPAKKKPLWTRIRSWIVLKTHRLRDRIKFEWSKLKGALHESSPHQSSNNVQS